MRPLLAFYPNRRPEDAAKGARHELEKMLDEYSEWAKTLPKHLFRPMRFKRSDGSTKIYYYVYERVVTLVKHKQRVKVFVTYEDLNKEPSFFCTNRLDWGKGEALRRYDKRWEIDVFYGTRSRTWA